MPLSQYQQRTVQQLFIASVVVGLVGCGTSTPTPGPQNPNAGRYSITQDRAPNRVIDLASIPEVVPEPVTRTAAGNKSPYTVLGRTYHVLPTDVGYREQGVASWYGEKFHGHRTSNGEIFDMYQPSAAHKSLPLPGYLRVTNLENNRSIIVRVNDRGPFHGNRLVDLSYAAALQLGYADRGTARVLLESVSVGSEQDRGADLARRQPPVAPAAGESVFLQVGAFADRTAAQRLSTQLRSLTRHQVFVQAVEVPGQGLLHRVRVGPLRDAGEIRRLSRSVVAANLGSPYTVTE